MAKQVEQISHVVLVVMICTPSSIPVTIPITPKCKGALFQTTLSALKMVIGDAFPTLLNSSKKPLDSSHPIWY